MHTFNHNSSWNARAEGGQKNFRVDHNASLSALRHVNVENLGTNTEDKIHDEAFIGLHNRFTVSETLYCSKMFWPYLLLGAYACVSPTGRMYNNATANELLKRML